MDMESRDEQKKRGIKRFLNSFKYSFDGLKYAYKYEQSLTIHFGISLIVIISGLYLKISLIEWLLCLLLMGVVMATELINTSLEAVIDLTCPEIHPLAKIAKDTASAAVFVFSTVAFFSGLIIFLPKIILLIESLI
ncbi:MAG: diacylglycerol kinase [Bacilli bacterium]|nr:diacylglycerol kinase [Bacilli bacterium]MDD4282609.1 diacylglycerol kinase [Bacilli bacterium]MDD4718521.1 diacylglycerol kinase [Bacilli bacterium]